MVVPVSMVVMVPVRMVVMVIMMMTASMMMVVLMLMIVMVVVFMSMTMVPTTCHISRVFGRLTQGDPIFVVAATACSAHMNEFIHSNISILFYSNRDR